VALATPLRRTLLTAPEVRPPAGLAGLLEQVDTGTGDEIHYEEQAPKHAFLRELLDRRAVLLHGTGDGTVTEFRPRRQTDFDGNWTTSVFASDDPIWPIFFAVVNRESVRSLVNACLRFRGESYYYFSVSADPRASSTWQPGWIYVLPRATFTPHPSGPEWMSPETVRPLARMRVLPSDFPFLGDVVCHRRGEWLPRVVGRATILRGRGRRRRSRRRP
jgi:hypothetical protein